MNDNVRSAARVLDLLELLAGAGDGLTLAEASERLKAPKSSTLMLLRTLAGRGYAVRGGDDRYRLNESFRQDGFGWGGQAARLAAVSGPVLRELADALGETAILGTLTDKGMVRLLAKAVTHENIRYDIDLGQDLPAYCTAIGRVLLAQMPSEARRHILDRIEPQPVTPHSLTDRAAIEARIEDAARDGISVVAEEYALGGTGAAVPIRLADGRVVGAVNAGCISPRYAGKEAEIATALRAAARTIAARLDNRGAA
ncbi:MAG: IclR family transcriptional regulator [Sphingopyxis terrae]|uniref:IclR family transcriptional regulator n=1 Tax=Sphingopyxis sp. Q841 TaxID=3458250 RepID=UPI0029ED13C1|nr:IclR family transcriptional regulator [Sphingopyxis terrae]